MLVLAEGCRVCVSLDSVEGVFERAARPAGGNGAGPALPASLPILSWGGVTGVPAPASERDAGLVLVVRAGGDRIGLAIDACLGVRDASFLGAPVLPTRLTDPASGDALCFVHMIDHRPHFIVDPRALASAAARTQAPPPASASAPEGDGGAP